MRVIGLDVHRSFAQVAVLAGTEIVEEQRLDLEHDAILEFGRGLDAADEVVLESTGNTAAIVRLLQPFVARVVIANPLQTRAIAHARVKTDKVDAAMLAKLHASGFLPEVWSADDGTVALRRTVSERVALVRSIRRTKSRIHAVLHANLVQSTPDTSSARAGGAGWQMCSFQMLRKDCSRVSSRSSNG